MTKRVLYPGFVGVGIAVFLAASLANLNAGQVAGGSISIDADDIAGVVTSAKGPEAGVWVIAETTSLPTKYSKTVVTDDQGRYLVPDLPKGTYTVWVRGYGLVDITEGKGGAAARLVNLTRFRRRPPSCGGKVIRTAYWHACSRCPRRASSPGTGIKGNGISENVKSQPLGLRASRQALPAVSQLGNKATRELPEAWARQSPRADRWEHRLWSAAGPHTCSIKSQHMAGGR